MTTKGLAKGPHVPTEAFNAATLFPDLCLDTVTQIDTDM